jgi:hypothetical protein
LYLTEKPGGQSFTHEEESVVALAGFAAVAIERRRRQTAPL